MVSCWSFFVGTGLQFDEIEWWTIGTSGLAEGFSLPVKEGA
jgi:hypothetical protein